MADDTADKTAGQSKDALTPLPSDGRGWPRGRVRVIAGRGRPSLQNVKEQARERRTESTLPRFYGNANNILHECTADHAEYAEAERGGISADSFQRIRVLRFSHLLVCALFGRFFTTDFTGFTDARKLSG
jgi:hypothetical protein